MLVAQIVNELNAIVLLFTLKWAISYQVNFISIKKKNTTSLGAQHVVRESGTSCGAGRPWHLPSLSPVYPCLGLIPARPPGVAAKVEAGCGS